MDTNDMRNQRRRSKNRGRGRPAGSLNHKTIFRHVMYEEVEMKEGDRAVKLTVLEVLIRKVCRAAMEGNAKALHVRDRYLSDYMEPYDTKKPTRGFVLFPTTLTMEVWERQHELQQEWEARTGISQSELWAQKPTREGKPPQNCTE